MGIRNISPLQVMIEKKGRSRKMETEYTVIIIGAVIGTTVGHLIGYETVKLQDWIQRKRGRK